MSLRLAQLRICLLLPLAALVACDNSSGPGNPHLVLNVTPDSLVLIRNTSAHIAVTVVDREGNPVTGIAVSYSIDDTSIATVNSVGIVQARTIVGRTAVRARAGGATAVVPVTVIGIPTAVAVTPADTAIPTTATLQYQAAVLDERGDTIRGVPVTWVSSDPSIATITSSGLAVAKSEAGSTTISAGYLAAGGHSTLRVAIPGVATQITITPRDTTISSRDSTQLTATARDGLGGLVSGLLIQWRSLDTSLATVSSTGVVHGRGVQGSVLIGATSGTVAGYTYVTIIDSLFVTRPFAGGVAYTAAISSNNVAYVGLLNESRITRVNLSSHTFDTSVTVSYPMGIAFNSTGSRAYATNGASSSISVVDVATSTVIDHIAVGSNPRELIVAPGDSIIYVGREHGVVGVRLATKEIIVQLVVSGYQIGLAIARDTLLYMSSLGTRLGDGMVVEFNLRTRTLGRTFPVGGLPQMMTVSPDGKELDIANQSGYVQFWNLDTGLQIGSNLILPAAAYDVTRRVTNGLLYLTSAGGYIYVVDPVDQRLVHATDVGGVTRRIVFTADGSMGLVANQNGWVGFLR